MSIQMQGQPRHHNFTFYTLHYNPLNAIIPPMKKSLVHLPKLKRDELKLIAKTILSSVQPEMIILFGSYARGNWVEGPHKQGKGQLVIKKKSDYDILVVTTGKDTAKDITLWDNIDEKCRNLSLTAYARIIAIDIKELNHLLEIGQYFYTDIKQEGILLYDTGKHKLASKRLLRPKELKRIARDHYKQWFESAKGFYRGYEFYLNDCDYKHAAFLLNQATEHAYKGILLVFTNYCPNEHYLGALSESAAKLDESLVDIFPQETARQRRIFKLLDYAYIGARYDPKYRIARTQLETLAKCVTVLIEQMGKICPVRIRVIGQRKPPACKPGKGIKARQKQPRKRKARLRKPRHGRNTRSARRRKKDDIEPENN